MEDDAHKSGYDRIKLNYFKQGGPLYGKWPCRAARLTIHNMLINLKISVGKP